MIEYVHPVTSELAAFKNEMLVKLSEFKIDMNSIANRK